MMMKLKPYPKYKNSGIKWIGEIPEGWEVRKLKHIAKIYSGTDIKKDGEFPIYGANGIIGYCERPSFKKERVIIGRVGSSGEINLAKERYGVSDNALIIDNDDRRSSTKFLFYLLNCVDFSDDISFNAQPLITATKVKEKIIQCPRIQDQTAIANFLDKKTARIDALLEKDKKLIALLKEKRTALINHAVTKGLPVRCTQTGLDPNVKFKDSGVEWIGKIPERWKVNKIKFVSNKVITGKTPPTDNYAYYDNGNINWFTPSDLGNNLILKKSSKKITPLAILKNKVSKYNPNTVLLVGIGATLGKVGIITDTGTSNQQINAIEFNEIKLYSKYGLYYLYGYKDALISLSNASTVGIFNQTQTANFIIIVPPLPEQTAIANFLDKATSKIDKTIELIEKKINLLEEYKKSLIHHVVTGKVDVRGVEI
jgi:type I restriction enzyme S subunit